MKLRWARMKKWKPVWVGIVAGLGFGMWEFFHSINSNDRPFYARPFIWLMKAIVPMVTSPGQRSEHSGIFFIAALLSYFIYFAVLGALLGLLFQWLLWIFRRLKHHDTADQTKT